jgi:hypothetical protein
LQPSPTRKVRVDLDPSKLSGKRWPEKHNGLTTF